jgi:hypothetical protein
MVDLAFPAHYIFYHDYHIGQTKAMDLAMPVDSQEQGLYRPAAALPFALEKMIRLCITWANLRIL